MQHSLRDRIIALSGIFQATRLVQQVARTGMCEQAPYEASVKSIFAIDSTTAEAVYDDAMNVAHGTRALIAQLGGSQASNNASNSDSNNNANNTTKARDIEITKYAIAVMVLERKLIKRGDLLNTIVAGIDNAKSQLTHYPMTHDNVIANLANVYTETVSTLKPRIIVNGENNHISNTSNANKIRTLLLAAIRAAVLWRQCGGTRWQLLLNRKETLNLAQTLLDEQLSGTVH